MGWNKRPSRSRYVDLKTRLSGFARGFRSRLHSDHMLPHRRILGSLQRKLDTGIATFEFGRVRLDRHALGIGIKREFHVLLEVPSPIHANRELLRLALFDVRCSGWRRYRKRIR